MSIPAPSGAHIVNADTLVRVSVDPRAASGFAHAARYRAVRPSYPRAAIDHVVAELGLERSSYVIDLAAGTGKLTQRLLAVFDEVLAVEPSPQMRALGHRHAVAGTAEAIPLRANSVDAVFVAQAFHWFDAPAAAADIARVLRPGGGLILVTNDERWQHHSWYPDLDALLTAHKPRRPWPSTPADDPARAAVAVQFEPLREATFPHTHTLDRRGFVDLVASWSWIVNLPDDTCVSLLARIADLVPDTVELDYDTRVRYAARRA